VQQITFQRYSVSTPSFFPILRFNANRIHTKIIESIDRKLLQIFLVKFLYIN